LGGFRAFTAEAIVYGFPVIDDETTGLFHSGTNFIHRAGLINRRRIAAGWIGQVRYLTAATADQVRVRFDLPVKPLLSIHSADGDDNPFSPE
jgi:hypothetical protein